MKLMLNNNRKNPLYLCILVLVLSLANFSYAGPYKVELPEGVTGNYHLTANDILLWSSKESTKNQAISYILGLTDQYYASFDGTLWRRYRPNDGGFKFSIRNIKCIKKYNGTELLNIYIEFLDKTFKNDPAMLQKSAASIYSMAITSKCLDTSKL